MAGDEGDWTPSELMKFMEEGRSLQLRDLIRIGANASVYEHAVNPHSSTLAFQRELSSQYLEGAYALSNGYLLTATILSAMLVHIIDGQH